MAQITKNFNAHGSEVTEVRPVIITLSDSLKKQYKAKAKDKTTYPGFGALY